MVGRQRRDTAPVVDPGRDQCQAFVARHQVWRRLDPHARPEYQARNRHRRQVILDPGIGHRGHRGVLLGPEILHNHFLDMAEFLVRLAYRVQGVRPFGKRLADADQQTCGERNGQPARVGQGAQPNGRVFVRAAVVCEPFRLEQPARRGFQHHAHRRRHRLEPRHLRPAQHAGIQVRQQPGLLQHPDRHRAHVRQRGVVAPFVKPVARLGPPVLGAVAESEQRFLATEFSAAPGHVKDLVGFHVHAHALGT